MVKVDVVEFDGKYEITYTLSDGLQSVFRVTVEFSSFLHDLLDDANLPDMEELEDGAWKAVIRDYPPVPFNHLRSCVTGRWTVR